MKIGVLLSGGVDSSVVLGLLAHAKEHQLTAFYLKIWLEDELHFLGECPWEEDLKFVRAVCEQFGVPLEIIPLQQEYSDRVVSYTISELKAGRTPSPDIFCNQRIKFGAFLDQVGNQFDKVASGHYATSKIIDGRAHLYKAIDPIKDQTYFLSQMNQDQLIRCLFPLGVYQKSEVRKLAEGMNLATMHRPDSQGICFLGKIKYNDFVKFHLGHQKGEIREWESGKVLGEHEGFWFHTFGQRKGLKLHGGPWFVVDKDIAQNIVYVSHSDLLATVARDTFYVSDIQWLCDPPKRNNLQVKLRHGPNLKNCTVSQGNSEGRLEVKLDSSDAGIANGQFAVFYDNDECLGSGMINLLSKKS